MKITSSENLEAQISTWDGRKILVRVPLFGEVLIAYCGILTFQMNDQDEPQFVVTRTENPAVSLVFQITDVNHLMHPEAVIPQIILKKPENYHRNIDNIA